MITTTATPTVPASKIDFFRTPAFDWMFVILGGLPLCLPFIFQMGESGLSQRAPVYWYFWINAVISAPHVYSTYWRLGRKIHEKRVPAWVGFPAYAVFVGLLMLASANGFFVHAMTAVNVWQSLHYLRQVYGVSRLYTREGLVDEAVRKISYAAFHLAMPLFILGRWDVLYTVWGGKPSDAIIPVNISDLLMSACWILAGFGMLAGVVSEVLRYERSKNGYDPAPAVILVIYFAIHFFGFISITYYQRGFFAVTIFHAVQYLGLVWVLEREQALGWIKNAYTAAPAVISFALFWAALFGAGYVFENYLLPSTRTVWPLLATVALSAISAHHYFVDTFIWRRTAGH
jgi:hypothetical protein